MGLYPLSRAALLHRGFEHPRQFSLATVYPSTPSGRWRSLRGLFDPRAFTSHTGVCTKFRRPVLSAFEKRHVETKTHTGFFFVSPGSQFFFFSCVRGPSSTHADTHTHTSHTMASCSPPWSVIHRTMYPPLSVWCWRRQKLCIVAYDLIAAHVCLHHSGIQFLGGGCRKCKPKLIKRRFFFETLDGRGRAGGRYPHFFLHAHPRWFLVYKPAMPWQSCCVCRGWWAEGGECIFFFRKRALTRLFFFFSHTKKIRSPWDRTSFKSPFFFQKRTNWPAAVNNTPRRVRSPVGFVCWICTRVCCKVRVAARRTRHSPNPCQLLSTNYWFSPIVELVVNLNLPTGCDLVCVHSTNQCTFWHVTRGPPRLTPR